jgi:hypothetical protein
MLDTALGAIYTTKMSHYILKADYNTVTFTVDFIQNSSKYVCYIMRLFESNVYKTQNQISKCIDQRKTTANIKSELLILITKQPCSDTEKNIIFNFVYITLKLLQK